MSTAADPDDEFFAHVAGCLACVPGPVESDGAGLCPRGRELRSSAVRSLMVSSRDAGDAAAAIAPPELLEVIDGFREALADARAEVLILERLTNRHGPGTAKGLREALDRIGARGANLIDVATDAVAGRL